MCTKIKFKHSPCPTCKGIVIGRTDKVFCSIKCKNEHHRSARILIKSRFGVIQKSLRRNLVVLEGILGTENNRMKIHKDALLKVGFNFEVGNYSNSKKQKSVFELANYIYKVEKSGIVYVKRHEELSDSMPVFFERWLVDFPKGLSIDSNWKPDLSILEQQKFGRWNE